MSRRQMPAGFESVCMLSAVVMITTFWLFRRSPGSRRDRERHGAIDSLSTLDGELRPECVFGRRWWMLRVVS
jgi:hypothetical protein